MTFPSQQPEYRRRNYHQYAERDNAARRARYAADAELRARRQQEGRDRRSGDPERYRARDAARRLGSLVNHGKQAIGRCLACGYDRHVGALQWHHVDPESKAREPSSLRHTVTDAIALAELTKCVLICANCHWEASHGVWTPPPALHAETQRLLTEIAKERALAGAGVRTRRRFADISPESPQG